ncbi:MAG: hypothetical protein ACRDNS_09650, partial [Trebonia sp.]
MPAETAEPSVLDIVIHSARADDVGHVSHNRCRDRVTQVAVRDPNYSLSSVALIVSMKRWLEY